MSHNHHHHHHHAPNAHAEANRETFNTEGRSLLHSDAAKKLAKDTTEAILKVYPFNKDVTKVLDFACGIGTLSFILAAHAKTIVGVDISPNVVQDFNDTAVKSGLSDKMKALTADLSDPAGVEKLDGAKFNLAFCSFAFHHLASPKDMTKVISNCLEENGAFIIVDFLSQDEELEGPLVPNPELSKEDNSTLIGGKSMRDIDHVVPHKHGFSKNEVVEMFVGAGLKVTKFAWAFNMNWGGEKKVFLAMGSK